MGRGRQKKYNSIKAGLISGISIPLAIFLAIYLLRYAEIDLDQYLLHLWKLKLTFKILSLCGFANLLLFFFFIKKKMDRAAQGILFATFLYAIVFLIFEFI